MLESYPMVVRDGRLFFPAEIKDRFLATGPLPLRDGRRVTPDEIWEFMTVEGPSRFPYAFVSKPATSLHLPQQFDLLSSIKLFYLVLSKRSRIESLRGQGKPLIFVQGGQPLEPYYAAESVPLRPGDIQYLATFYYAEGQDVRNKDWKQMDLHEEGNRTVSMEACHQIISHTAIRGGVVPVDLMAPYTRTRCSDVTFLVESHRDSPLKTDLMLVDYPVNYEPHKTWAVEYVAAGLRSLVSKIDSLTGRTTTEDDLREQIRVQNRIRQLTREIVELWRTAPVPPASSSFIPRILALGKDCDGDPVATEHILAQMRDEVQERVNNSVKGGELATRPVRLFKGGSCFDPDLHRLDRAGGVLVGTDDWWSDVWALDVALEGDPYENYARATLAAPYELESEKRAQWVATQVKESRADGLIFGYQWGCNFQSAVAQLVCDAVEKEADVPCMILGVDGLGRGESREQTDNRIEAFVEMLQS